MLDILSEAARRHSRRPCARMESGGLVIDGSSSLNYHQNGFRIGLGEDRYQLLGRIDGRLFFVAYTVRGGIVRIISARKANRREVREYEDSARDA